MHSPPEAKAIDNHWDQGDRQQRDAPSYHVHCPYSVSLPAKPYRHSTIKSLGGARQCRYGLNSAAVVVGAWLQLVP